ncbi:GGDEF domain-containing protein [Modestobacter muralis]|uniref:GGDEF domain-containing protein n=1 Tax=Modestobacter muralis TaxID=1608614 RepID=A0A6P0EXN0_9ACTN|nr:GGDEF domain-containing protein [Modestobacter muralis]NEK96452.1 GGDEF domain-containing protein [Modestobacter muralis]NEN53352.1 GGDEF domain-containing protein [Modestobacter muralis]
MPFAAHPLLAADQRADAATHDAITLLPSRVTLLDRIAERARTVTEAPATLLLIGLLRRDTAWPMAGSQLDQVAAALSADLRGTDWLARSGPTEFAVLLDGVAHDAETAATRLVTTIADAGVEGVTACVGIAGLSRDASPGEVHRRATLCLTAARSIGAGRVIRYSGGRP